MNTPAKRNPYLHAFHRISSGRMIHAKQLARAIQIANAQPLSTYYRETLTDCMGGTGREFLKQVAKFFADEMARRAGTVSRGRKDCKEWFYAARNVADKLNGRRIRCYVNECPKELRVKLAHRLVPDGERD